MQIELYNREFPSSGDSPNCIVPVVNHIVAPTAVLFFFIVAHFSDDDRDLSKTGWTYYVLLLYIFF